MTCSEIAKEMAATMGISYSIVWPIVQEFCTQLGDQLDGGHSILVPGIGRFKWIQERPRSGVSIRTGKRWSHPSQRKLKWYPTSKLRGGR